MGRRKKPPPLGKKFWMIASLIGAGVVGIVIMNAEFGRLAAERARCHQTQTRIAEAVEKLRETSPELLEKSPPEALSSLLVGRGLLEKWPDHPGTPADAASPILFGHNGAVHCKVHGAAGK